MRVWKQGTPGIPSTAIYIGRGSIWGNPYVIGRHGTRDEVLAKYDKHVQHMLAKHPNWLEKLRGHDLVCHCCPLPCHGDILIRYLYSVNRDEHHETERVRTTSENPNAGDAGQFGGND